MCGIIGYIGDKDISSVLMVALERLSYRGYDSSGIAIIADNELSYWKKAGKTQVLNNLLTPLSIQGSLGIGHTRWATHGIPSDINAHPHVNIEKKLAVVHNGIIENFITLKNSLIDKGYLFTSNTDTEVLAHLLSHHYKTSLEQAVLDVIPLIQGAYAFVVISELDPSKIVCARYGSPLIVGISENEAFVASDVNVLLHHTKNVVYLENKEIAVLSKDNISYLNFSGKTISKDSQKVSFNSLDSSKGGYDHFMLKEIYEQPLIVQNILDKYLKGSDIVFKDIDFIEQQITHIRRFIIQACGTSWHAGLIAKYFIEKYASILTEVDTSSEFRYKNMLASQQDILMAISQSGETADTLACLREAKSKFLKVLSFVNVKNSAMDIESDSVIYSHSGQEIGVASTKNYTAQITTLLLFSIHVARIKGTMDETVFSDMIVSLRKLPNYLQLLLNQHASITDVARKYFKYKNFIFIGRGVNYPSALEGSLKLKEISYIHSTAYPAGELKHGPIALIDENMPVVALCPDTDTYSKMANNLQEVKARSAKTIVICTEGNRELEPYADDIIYIPKVPQYLTPFLISVPLQLLAYEIANMLGCDVDKPRNLAKSVTVE
ncbi:MAG: glutamine--fructose-6-phosphate transaminase (isomerizing) [bacterium]